MTNLKLEELMENLYNLDRTELRRLAYEALLISDGPDKIEGSAEDATVQVEFDVIRSTFHIKDLGVMLEDEYQKKYARYIELKAKFDQGCEHELCNKPGEYAFGFTEEEIGKITECLVERGMVDKLSGGENKLTDEFKEYSELKLVLFE